MQFLITMFSPIWERWFLLGESKDKLTTLQNLEEMWLIVETGFLVGCGTRRHGENEPTRVRNQFEAHQQTRAGNQWPVGQVIYTNGVAGSEGYIVVASY